MVDFKTISFDRIATDYDRTRWVPSKLRDKFFNKLIDEVPLSTESQIFELGVGTGRLAIPFSRLGYKMFGIDVSLLMLKEAIQNRGKDHKKLYLLQADANSLPIKEKSFDFCLFVHILHLLENWKGVIDSVERVLKKQNLAHSTLHVSWHDLEPFRLYWNAIGRGETRRIGAKNPEEVVDYLQDSKGYHCDHFEFEENAGTALWEDAVNLIQEKAFSSQWGIQTEQHQAALEEVKQKMKGKEKEPLKLKARCVIDLFRLE
ncbi:MAG: class I SAM-dependent methyltransferase [Candidatus Thorarchaeota archaeon]